VIAPRVSFQGLDASDAVRERIAEQLSRLEQIEPRIDDCRVTVSKPHRHRARHPPFSVHVDLHVPGHHLVATHDSESADVHTAVRNAFAAIERQLDDLNGRRKRRR
jgi:ribosomal subunit interface protein